MTGPLERLGDYLRMDPLNAAREGRGIHMGIHDADGIATGTISADADMFYPLAEGQRVLITHVALGVDTASEELHAAVGYTDAGLATGIFTALHPTLHYETGATPDLRSPYDREFNPPLVASYAEGARFVTMVLSPTDTATLVNAGWDGWFESERVIE